MKDNPQMNQRDNLSRRTNLDILRIILTILVVVGHGTYYRIVTEFGGVDYVELMANSGVSDSLFHVVANKLTTWIYTYHMPAYFCLSGVVFDIELKKGKYGSIKELVRTKAQRLLIPLLFVWLIWNVPIKIAVGYYAGSKSPVFSGLIQMIFSEKVYLWFLEALFLIFIFDYKLMKCVRNQKLQLAILAVLYFSGLFISRYFAGYVPLGNPFRYFLWFWLGHHIDEIIQCIKGKISHVICGNGEILCVETAAFMMLYVVSRITVEGRWLWGDFILAFMGIIWLWEVSSYIDKKIGDEIKKIITRFSSYTYGVYLWAEPLNYLVLYIALNIGGISLFGSEWGGDNNLFYAYNWNFNYWNNNHVAA